LVSVAIPSVRGGDELVALVAQLRNNEVGYQLFVADNGLDPSIITRLRAERAIVIPMPANLGFAAAVNAVARRADGEILVVANDDLTVRPGFLDALIAPVRAGATMAAGVLLQAGTPNVIETAGIEIDRTLGAHDYLRGESVAVLERDLPPPVAPCGGAAAYHLEAFRDVGGFDEGFFAYFEDLDLGLRLRARGASCALAPMARAIHTGSATLGAGSLEKALVVGFSRGYLLRKYGVLSEPVPGVLALAQETAASILLVAQQRSVGPAVTRVRGWRACRVRARRPPDGTLTVGAGEAWRRRYLRSTLTRA
jgi:N-acetylglucosaminyl-diphospho-decaprenol L-rhamnosyltransferase